MDNDKVIDDKSENKCLHIGKQGASLIPAKKK